MDDIRHSKTSGQKIVYYVGLCGTNCKILAVTQKRTQEMANNNNIAFI